MQILERRVLWDSNLKVMIDVAIRYVSTVYPGKKVTSFWKKNNKKTPQEINLWKITKKTVRKEKPQLKSLSTTFTQAEAVNKRAAISVVPEATNYDKSSEILQKKRSS